MLQVSGYVSTSNPELTQAEAFVTIDVTKNRKVTTIHKWKKI